MLELSRLHVLCFWDSGKVSSNKRANGIKNVFLFNQDVAAQCLLLYQAFYDLEKHKKSCINEAMSASLADCSKLGKSYAVTCLDRRLFPGDCDDMM